MILIICTHCRCALRVTGDMEEAHCLVGPGSDLWPNKFACFRCSKPAHGFLESEVSLKTQLEVHEVSPQEAFAAIHGLGIPAEREVDKLIVEALLREHPVRRVSCKDIIGGQRVLVDHIELWDGTKLHFASSNDGAVVYRITRPHSYADKVTP
jgi:hypothetical protein